uniref:tRNA(Phe) (4-demethylwyosine(37)-C(7)) aminocarboxypropyltransferase n=1 Tax=Ciona intestinalis TaxID=7719 RepID=H2Y0C0_CIOIN
DLPRKWEKHGDLVMLPSNCFHLKVWAQLPQEQLWKYVAEALNVNRVAQQKNILNSDYRSPQVVMLLGDDTWVTHIDNRIIYKFDITKSMFSSGNITEKIRMANLNCDGEIVIDMFAGIGYFTLPLLVHSKARFVHACEWNPDSVTALKANLLLNKVESKCKIYEGDNRVVCPTEVGDRIILGLIPTAEQSYIAACKALKVKGGIFHIHHNVTSIKNNDTEKGDIKYENLTCNRKIKKDWMQWALNTCKQLLTILKQVKSCNSMPGWCITLVHIERVKSYAPCIDHLVLDLVIHHKSLST